MTSLDARVVYQSDGDVTLYHGDALTVLQALPDGTADCCVTSPPYFGQRDYGTEGQIGHEDSPSAYLERLCEVFAEVRRVLADDGTLWLNLGDTYYSGRGNPGPNSADRRQTSRRGWTRQVDRPGMPWGTPKSLLLIPERLLLALYGGGWTIRSKGVWRKPNAMPNNAEDRLEGTWEPFYLLTKSRRYWFQYGEPDVWDISVRPTAEPHAAPFPVGFPVRCIRSGCKPGGTVLDPFSGSGTTGLAARLLGHPYIGIDVSKPYCETAARRLSQGVLDLPEASAS